MELYNAEEIVAACKAKLNEQPWSGPEIPNEIAHAALSIKQLFSASGMTQNKEQGRDLTDMVLMLAFQFGYANGCRHKQQEIDLLHRYTTISQES